MSKDVEPSKKAKSTETSKGTTKSLPKSTSKSAQAEETVFEAGDTQVPQNLGEDMGNTDEPPVVNVDLKVWFKESKRPHSLYPECTSRTYTTSLTKTKAALYDLQGTKYMVPNLWSPVIVAYNIHALLGTSHWRSKRQTFYGYASNRVSRHDVYSTKRILAVTKVKVNKWYGYGHLEEIEVQRSDHQLYTFMKGDFPRHHLNDIEDMLFFVVKNRLFNLKGEDIVHLAAALHMLTRRIVIQKRVKDLQLGVKSYQRKLNISRPLMHKAGVTDIEPYTT
nr:hypothetical protein [Tanacetum cinerariifolium]